MPKTPELYIRIPTPDLEKPPRGEVERLIGAATQQLLENLGWLEQSATPVQLIAEPAFEKFDGLTPVDIVEFAVREARKKIIRRAFGTAVTLGSSSGLETPAAPEVPEAAE